MNYVARQKAKIKLETIQIIQWLKYIRTNSSQEVHVEVGKENWKIEWTENKSSPKNGHLGGIENSPGK